MELLRSWSAWYFAEKRRFKQLKISAEDRMILMNKDQILCCLCGSSVERVERVVHHCHRTGEIFGVALSKCSLRAKTMRCLPILFHNLSQYDAHHTIKCLKLNNGENISAIAENDETYIFFSLDLPMERFKSKSGQHIVLYHYLRFIDSFKFMSQSIDSLAKAIDKGHFNLLKPGFPDFGEGIFEKITRKGFFAYNFLDLFEKFNEHFPPHGPLWYNILKKSVDITKEQHTFALGIYNDLKCRNLGDYHDVYLRTDVLILGDIFQKFREVCMQVCNLDPAHC